MALRRWTFARTQLLPSCLEAYLESVRLIFISELRISEVLGAAKLCSFSSCSPIGSSCSDIRGHIGHGAKDLMVRRSVVFLTQDLPDKIAFVEIGRHHGLTWTRLYLCRVTRSSFHRRQLQLEWHWQSRSPRRPRLVAWLQIQRMLPQFAPSTYTG
jgi:hypothetical protein